ncbi:MAG: hypothetical protein JHC37_06880 [Campylobacteraceae bacterium]|nr:hypothetical protein [Campylobacteraceae bacterium]
MRVKRFYGDRENEKRITRLELWLTSYVDGVPTEDLISDWDADQYDTVETYDAEYFLFVSPTLKETLEQMSA